MISFLIDVLGVVMKKICRICHKELDINCFRKSGKYYRGECKECAKVEYKKWYLKNKDKRKEHVSKIHKEYYVKNRDKFLKYQVLYRKEHSNEIKEYKKEYYQNNKEKIDLKNKDNYYKYNDYYKNYYKNNKIKIKLYRNIFLKNPINKLKKQIRNMIYDSFKRQHKVKKRHSEELLGCDLDFFVNYLLDTYKNNYGIEWDKIEKVHIDHIIPLATAKTEEDVIKLCHYKNLQLLKAEDNLKKSDKVYFKEV